MKMRNVMLKDERVGNKFDSPTPRESEIAFKTATCCLNEVQVSIC